MESATKLRQDHMKSERAFEPSTLQLYGIHGPSKSPNRYLVDLGTLSLVGRSHIKYSNFFFGRDIMSRECSVIVWPTLAGKTQNKTLRTLQSIWEFHGVATCVQLLDWQEIHRNSFHGETTAKRSVANHAYKALSYDIADLPASVSKKPQLQQVKRSMSKRHPIRDK